MVHTKLTAWTSLAYNIKKNRTNQKGSKCEIILCPFEMYCTELYPVEYFRTVLYRQGLDDLKLRYFRNNLHIWRMASKLGGGGATVILCTVQYTVFTVHTLYTVTARFCTLQYGFS